MKFLIICAICANIFILRAQEKTDSLSGFGFEFSYTGDIVCNTSGGIAQGTSYLGLAHVVLNFSTEKNKLWKGGELIIHASNTHGGQPSAQLIGDYQIVSNIEAGNRSYIHELKFVQSIGKINLILGLQDLNAEFAYTVCSQSLINSSFGIPSTMSHNAPMPIFPLTRPGLTAIWEVTNGIKFKASYFDGLRSDFNNNEYNTNWALNTTEGIIFLGELDFTNPKSIGKPFSLKIGLYNHHFTETQDSIIKINSKRNNAGLYFMASKQIFNFPNREGGLSVFTQIALSNRKKNDHSAYFGAGLSVTNFWQKRSQDEISFGVAQSFFCHSDKKNETTFELAYKCSIGNYFYVQPDVQYIIHPQGTGLILDNCLAAIFRFGFEF